MFTETATLEVWPLIDLTLDMPEAIPVDQSASVSLHGTDLSVMWKVTAEDGTVFTPALYKEGGEITFPAAGTYTVTASVTDGWGARSTPAAQFKFGTPCSLRSGCRSLSIPTKPLR